MMVEASIRTRPRMVDCWAFATASERSAEPSRSPVRPEAGLASRPPSRSAGHEGRHRRGSLPGSGGDAAPARVERRGRRGRRRRAHRGVTGSSGTAPPGCGHHRHPDAADQSDGGDRGRPRDPLQAPERRCRGPLPVCELAVRVRAVPRRHDRARLPSQGPGGRIGRAPEGLARGRFAGDRSSIRRSSRACWGVGRSLRDPCSRRSPPASWKS